jgi:hypothetical protein
MISAQLSRQLARHFQANGAFGPFTYTIGLEASVAEAEEAMQVYPLTQPISDETLAKFIKSLTFFHEATHLNQFLSSAYGLRTLRYTLICLRNLGRCESWQLPIIHNLSERIEHLSPGEFRAYENALIFLDGIDQLRLHQYAISPEYMPPGQAVAVDVLPWSPHFFQLGDQSYESRAEHARYLASIGAHVRKLPRLFINSSPQAYLIVLNVAALAESFAVLVEMNHINNALGITTQGAFELLPPGNEYHALTTYMLRSGLCTIENVFPALAVCIDAALMYDPFILYNVPWDVADKDGHYDQYPGETFLMLCEALKKTSPINKTAPEEWARFYRELCANAGLPDPNWMAQKTYEVAHGLLAKAPAGQEMLLGRALKAHTDALRYRCEKGADVLPYYMTTTACANEMLVLALPAVSFYNLHTGQPDGFDPRKIDGVTMHSILCQAFTEPAIRCPLKQGNPFFCESALKPANELCVWQYQDGTRVGECWLDILERQYRLTPA